MVKGTDVLSNEVGVETLSAQGSSLAVMYAQQSGPATEIPNHPVYVETPKTKKVE